MSEPLVLEPVLVERVWGSRDLRPWVNTDSGPLPQPVGEAWLTDIRCNLREAGQGRSFADALRIDPAAFGAVNGSDGEPGFPLLLKLLFPKEKLSVQVHPNDVQARAAGHSRGKTECWYVLDAEPGATVAVGLREPLSEAELREAIENGCLEDRLVFLPVHAGDMVYVDAGTVHAIGPGVVILEIQQYSDVTYRLYDYGRPRELHLEQGLAVVRGRTDAGLVSQQPMDEFVRLLRSPYFTVDRFDLEGKALPLRMGSQMQILVALQASCQLQRGETSLELPAGAAVVVPAESDGGSGWTLSGKGQVVRVTASA